MLFKLFLIFTIIPLIELAILVKIALYIGIFYTIAIVIGTAVLGAYMAKMEGLSVIFRFQKNMLEGIFPAEEILDGAMLLVAGAFLVTPGVLTDIIGFLIVIPASRAIIKGWIKGYLRGKMRLNLYN
jgi:UPF0716 protein FxsA